jgi:3',5'-cyclic AMP phosphodiesterase CpdA
MGTTRRLSGTLHAISDLHVSAPENRRVLDTLHPADPEDCLLLCGDVGETERELEQVLDQLTARFATVIWTPGNHELWSQPSVPEDPRGVPRYERLVDLCRSFSVLTPEDPYPVWDGPGGPVLVAPLFLLYDYTFGSNIAPTQAEALARAHKAGVVCSDEYLLHAEPYSSREAWCHARVALTERRLEACDPALPTVLVAHFPLIVEPTRALRHQEFAQWCGTVHTADWPRRFRARTVVYGHLHIPRTSWHHGVRFEEVSLGYPREWCRQGPRALLRRILPSESA